MFLKREEAKKERLGYIESKWHGEPPSGIARKNRTVREILIEQEVNRFPCIV